MVDNKPTFRFPDKEPHRGQGVHSSVRAEQHITLFTCCNGCWVFALETLRLWAVPLREMCRVDWQGQTDMNSWCVRVVAGGWGVFECVLVWTTVRKSLVLEMAQTVTPCLSAWCSEAAADLNTVSAQKHLTTPLTFLFRSLVPNLLLTNAMSYTNNFTTISEEAEIASTSTS